MGVREDNKITVNYYHYHRFDRPPYNPHASNSNTIIKYNTTPDIHFLPLLATSFVPRLLLPPSFIYSFDFSNITKLKPK